MTPTLSVEGRLGSPRRKLDTVEMDGIITGDN